MREGEVKGLRKIYILSLLVFLLLPFVLACQRPTIQSGFDMPGVLLGPTGMNPAYDQVTISPYLGNLSYVGGTSYVNSIKTIELVLNKDFNTLHVVYRSDIETQPAQTRYNILNIWIPDRSMESENVTLKLANIHTGFMITYIISHRADYDGHYRTALKIDISPTTMPGYYRFEMLVFSNDKFYGMVPFIIHVIE
jgi:hypothetical protein